MAVGYRSTGTAGAVGAATSITLAAPAGLVATDLQLGWIATSAAAAVITPPAGWTLIRRPAGVGGALYWAPGTVSAYQWNVSISSTIVGWVTALTGADLTAPIADSAEATNTGTVAAVGGVNALNDGMLFGLWVAGVVATWTPPGSMTERQDTFSGMTATEPSTAGPTGTRTATATASSAWLAILAAIRSLEHPHPALVVTPEFPLYMEV